MLKASIFIFCLIPFFTKAQPDILVLTKRGKHVHTFTTGQKVNIETIYQQQFKGIITEIWHDSIFIDGLPFHYREIASFQGVRLFSGFLMMGSGLMIGGGGFIFLSAVNGLVRDDKFQDWYTGHGLITVGVFEVAGYLLRNAFYVKYNIGNKYQLQYFNLNPNKK